MSDENQALLEAEKVVQELAAELRNLKTETERYATAGKALAATREELSALMARLGAQAEGLQRVVEAIRQTGTAEILAGVNSLSSTIADAKAEASAAREAVNQAASRSVEGTQDTKADLAARAQHLSDAIGAASGSTGRDISRLEGFLGGRLGQLQQAGTSQAKEIVDAIAATRGNVAEGRAEASAALESLRLTVTKSADGIAKEAAAAEARLTRLVMVAAVLAGAAVLVGAGTFAWIAFR